MLYAAVKSWLQGQKSAPRIAGTCFECGARVKYRLPRTIDDVVLEYRTSFDDSPAIVDVALVAQGKLRLAIEIRDSHPVDGRKVGRLVGTSWIELAAFAVTKEPFYWIPVAQGNLNWRCRRCSSNPKAHSALLRNAIGYLHSRRWSVRRVATRHSDKPYRVRAPYPGWEKMMSAAEVIRLAEDIRRWNSPRNGNLEKPPDAD